MQFMPLQQTHGGAFQIWSHLAVIVDWSRRGNMNWQHFGLKLKKSFWGFMFSQKLITKSADSFGNAIFDDPRSSWVMRVVRCLKSGGHEVVAPFASLLGIQVPWGDASEAGEAKTSGTFEIGLDLETGEVSTFYFFSILAVVVSFATLALNGMDHKTQLARDKDLVASLKKIQWIDAYIVLC